MKVDYIITIVLIIGLATLFFFPNPESNFFEYIGTAIFFIALIVFLLIWQKKK